MNRSVAQAIRNVMKRAMWRVDTSGQFKFSDKHSGQLMMLPGFDDVWLASHLAQVLAGRRLLLSEIRMFVLEKTPCYRYKTALKMAETKGDLVVLDAPGSRRAGTFADNEGFPFAIQFENRLQFE